MCYKTKTYRDGQLKSFCTIFRATKVSGSDFEMTRVVFLKSAHNNIEVKQDRGTFL